MSSSLDLHYIADLFEQARKGDSNAFAEFYAATFQKEYAFACSYLKKDYLAKEALRNTYLRALTEIGKISNGDLILAWLTELNIRACFEIQQKHAIYEKSVSGKGSDDPESAELSIDGTSYSMRRIFSLPFTESQAVILKYICGMKYRDIAALEEISVSEVKRYIRSAIDRLNGVSSANYRK